MTNNTQSETQPSSFDPDFREDVDLPFADPGESDFGDEDDDKVGNVGDDDDDDDIEDELDPFDDDDLDLDTERARPDEDDEDNYGDNEEGHWRGELVYGRSDEMSDFEAAYYDEPMECRSMDNYEDENRS